MPSIINIGRRIELIPIDTHFHEITIALYREELDACTVFRIHTYSRKDGVSERIQQVANYMHTLGGMGELPNGKLIFPCGDNHEAACRRVFLEACKIPPNTTTEPRPLNILDKKSKLMITVDSIGNGVYRVTSNGEGRSAERRVSAIAGGLMKLGEMDVAHETDGDTVCFACGHSHDALVGLLLVRAPNVRVVMRAEEASASRGVLSAPSQQL